MISLTAIPNPFRSPIVSDPWKSLEADVPAINQKAFARCCEAIAAARAQGQTTGVLVHGAAGSGKTHLLARLRDHVAREAEADGPGGMEEAVFVSVQLQTSAKMIWRHLRRCLAADLLRRGVGSVSQFERLLLHQLTKNGLIAGAGHAWLEQVRKDAHSADQLCETLDSLFELIDPRGQIGYKLRRVIASLLLKRHLTEAKAWLRGESLPKAALQKLEIDASANNDEEAGEAEEQDDQDTQVVLGLCGLATAELPMVFCFDQVEALQTHAEDQSGLFAFGQMISELQAATRHLLIISCLQSAFLNSLSRAVRRADFDRIRSFDEVALNPLNEEEARQLIKARLDSAPDLRQLRAQQADPLWPLQAAEIKPVFTPTGCTARSLLARCSDLYEAHRNPSADAVTITPPKPIAPIELFLDQSLGERRQKALETSEPAQTEQIITHGLPSLLYLTGKRWRQEIQNIPAGVDLLFESPSGRVAVSVCNSKHGPSLVKKLDRLRKLAQDEPATKLILLRDSRLPVGPTAIKTRALREQLLQKGARWVEPSVEALVTLDALRRLLSDAKSGELDNHGETIELQTVQDWLVANLAAEMKNTLEEILLKESGLEPIIDLQLYEAVADLLQRHPVVSVTDAATLLGHEVTEIAECARQNADRIGALGEPPSVLFHLVSDGLAT